jgi:voltage-gated potassium channel
MTGEDHPEPRSGLRETVHEIIFEADTPTGRLFDVALLLAIVVSVIAVMLESVVSFATSYGRLLVITELVLTGLFTIEYLLRLWSTDRPWRYATSFYGLVDLLSILPTYISAFIPGARSLAVIRALRLLRIFRVLKLGRYLKASAHLSVALQASLPKIIVFLFAVLTVVMITGSAMYFIEGGDNGFTSIPRSVYWAIVTMTTVGYGDIHPKTEYGQALAALLMILGYGVIAVPTGIVSVEMSKTHDGELITRSCRSCTAEIRDPRAKYCRMCGSVL